jgi:hypothetical protein
MGLKTEGLQMKLNFNWLGFFLIFYCLPSQANINPNELHQSIALIEVTVGKGEQSKTYVSSGFMWQTDAGNMVITALHGMRPNAEKISIQCAAGNSDAKVEKIFKEADLVLLKPDRHLNGCIPLSKNKIDTNAPKFDESLFAFGYYPGASQSDTKKLSKSSRPSPELYHVLTEEVRVQLRNLELPSMQLAVYSVNGGIFKGYSGGPVFNKQGNLIGTVSGGLDKGMTDTNWLVPIDNIYKLLSSDIKDIPTTLSNTDNLFSAVLKNSTIIRQNNNLSSQTSQPDDVSATEFRWIKTKAKTFGELLETADPLLGLEELYWSIVPSEMTAAEEALAFDVYEEESLGLIIAVPRERELSLEKDGEGFIISSMSKLGQADVRIKYNVDLVFDTAYNVVSPSHKDYFTLALDARLNAWQCHTEEMTCELDRDQFRIVDFGQGNKIARAAVIATGLNKLNGIDSSHYYYLSFVVKGEDEMVVDTLVNLDEENSTLLACFRNESKQSCGASFWDPASYILANAVTTYSDFVIRNGNPAQIYEFAYQCDNAICSDMSEETNSDENYTDSAEQVSAVQLVDDYFVNFNDQNGDAVFQMDTSGQWWLMGTLTQQTLKLNFIQDELSNNILYAHVNDQNFSYLVPYDGGVWFILSNVDGQNQWKEGGAVQANVTSEE